MRQTLEKQRIATRLPPSTWAAVACCVLRAAGLGRPAAAEGAAGLDCRGRPLRAARHRGGLAAGFGAARGGLAACEGHAPPPPSSG